MSVSEIISLQLFLNLFIVNQYNRPARRCQDAIFIVRRAPEWIKSGAIFTRFYLKFTFYVKKSAVYEKTLFFFITLCYNVASYKGYCARVFFAPHAEK
ncbi:MAG TPA: hypothetical protein DD415_01765 [Clostridiales bacterium]|nr:hypothetical protein [Clostridiales bacterium]